jgi:hypothetical protein
LNYAGEYWSFHLRAAGGWSATNHQREARYRDGLTENLVLVDFATTTLEKGIDTASGVCLAFSTALKSIDVQKIRSLPKVIALRKLQTTILPATRAMERLKSSLKDISTTLQESQGERRLTSASPISEVQFDTSTTTLDSNLNSETALRVLASLRTYGPSTLSILSHEQRRRKKHIEVLCEASRTLRQLSILLAIDPVRAWIYSQTGESGVSPLVALAHTSEAIDTYLATSLLSPELFARYDFRDQFNAQHSHPQYGLISATRRELSVKTDSSLDPTFYKEHVRKHYSISTWEWNTTRLLIAALEMSAEDPSGLDQAIKIWLSNNRLLPQNTSDDREPAFNVMSRLPSQSIYKSARKIKQLISTLAKGAAVISFKYLIYIVPPLEHVFLSAMMYGGLLRSALAPTLKLLISNRKDFSVVLVLYLMRCRYSPWLFGTSQTVRWNSIFGAFYDVRGIIADPKGYTPPFMPTAWPWLLFFYYMGQELVIWIPSIFDVISAQAPADVSYDFSPKDLLRRTSFRFDWSDPDTRGQFDKLRRASVSHVFAYLVTLRRLLFIERLFGTVIVWVYDLLSSAAIMTGSSPWKGKSVLLYGIQLIAFAYGRSGGLIKGIKLVFRVYFYTVLVEWYQPSSLFGLTYRYAYLPAKDICIRACIHYLEYVLATVSSLFSACEASIIQGVNSLGARTLLFTVAGAICFAGLLFWYIMSDPLSLKSAARSREEAEDWARKTTSIQDPITFLKWRSEGTTEDHAIAFTDLSLDYEAVE